MDPPYRDGSGYHAEISWRRGMRMITLVPFVRSDWMPRLIPFEPGADDQQTLKA